MRGKIFSIAIVTLLVLSRCNTTAKNGDNKNQKDPVESITTKEQDIPFTIAQRYFVNNTYNDGDLENPKITSQAAFDKLFGAATVMGKNGKPTAIDFSKQYVLAIIGKLTDRNTSITVNSLRKKGNMILFNYKITEGEKQSVIIRPALLVIVDNEYQGEIKLTAN